MNNLELLHIVEGVPRPVGFAIKNHVQNAKGNQHANVKKYIPHFLHLFSASAFGFPLSLMLKT